MRLFVDARPLAAARTGMARFGSEVLARLPPLLPEVELCLLTARGQDPDSRPGIARKWAPASRPFSMASQLELPGLLRRLGADLLLSFTYDAPVGGSVPSVVVLFDAIHLRFPGLYPRRYQAYWRLIGLPAVRGARLVVTPSLSSARDAVNLVGVDPARLRLVPAGVGLPFRPLDHAAAAGEAARRFGLSSPFVLVHGNMRPHKNVGIVLEALARLAPGQRGPGLVLSGQGAHSLAAIRSRADELGLGERVRFVGSLADTDLVLLYNAADALVFPSLYEGMGLPPLEAMACGTPVVTGLGSALEEWYGDAALLADVRDADDVARAMLRVLTEPGLAAALAARGLEKAGELSWERTAAGVAAAIRSAAGMA